MPWVSSRIHSGILVMVVPFRGMVLVLLFLSYVYLLSRSSITTMLFYGLSLTESAVHNEAQY
jgi:hypothetical protein